MHSEGVIFHSGEPEPAPRDIEFDWRLLGWCVVLGLVGAAGWALVELLSGRLDYDDARVVVTSLAFAAASTTGASGLAAVMRPSPALRVLGVVTIGCSVVAFALLTAMIWHDDFPYSVHETLWRWCGSASVVAIAGGHASLMLRTRRPTDSALIQVVTFGSLAFGVVDAAGVLSWLLELADDISDAWGRRLAAVLVLLIVTTVLAPLLRQLQAAPAAAPKPAETPITA